MRVTIETDYPIEQNKLLRLLRHVNTDLKTKVERLYLHFVSDEEILKINNLYLSHDYYTDIITFDLRDEITNDVEMYISIDRIRENAQSLALSESEELFRVCVHGMLHLNGYNDKTAEEVIIMRGLEDKYLSPLFHVKRS